MLSEMMWIVRNIFEGINVLIQDYFPVIFNDNITVKSELDWRKAVVRPWKKVIDVFFWDRLLEKKHNPIF